MKTVAAPSTNQNPLLMLQTHIEQVFMGKEAVVQNAVILQQAKVPPNATVKGAVISSQGPVT